MKKNKILKRIGIGALALILLYGIVRVTGILQLYVVPTSGNSPAINPEDIIMATNLATYDRFDFVCYNQNNSKFPTGVRVNRVCGLPGDEVLIRNGTLYVNGKNVDKLISVMHHYYADARTIGKLANEINCPICDPKPDSCRISIQDSEVTKSMNAILYINNNKGVISSEFNKNWTLDNFGPLIIPKGSLFLLGDNRHNSLDSRMTGLISEDDVVGVVINASN